MVCKLVYPHSVFELSAVQILAWSGVGCLDFCMCRVLLQFIVQPGGRGGRQNDDWTPLPPLPGAQYGCSPQLGSVAQPQRKGPPAGKHAKPVKHGNAATNKPKRNRNQRPNFGQARRFVGFLAPADLFCCSAVFLGFC